MKTFKILSGSIFAATLLVSPSAHAATDATANITAYTITNLGTLGGKVSKAYAINTSGQIVGEADTTGGDRHAFLYSDGKMQDLGALGGKVSKAAAINDSGQIVGVADTATNLPLTPVQEARQARGAKVDTAVVHAFLYSAGKMQDLGDLGSKSSAANAINASGQIVGVGNTANILVNDGHAFLYSVGKIQDLGTLGGKSSMASAINASGQIVGTSDVGSDNQRHGFLYSAGKMQDLGSLGGDSHAYAINTSGQIIGESETSVSGRGNMIPDSHAFLYDGGKIQDLGTLGGKRSRAHAINASGQIVGETATTAAGDWHVFLYSGGKMQDLQTLLGDNALATAGIKVLSEATGINDRGQIVGTATDAQGNSIAYLLTPAEKK